jgi:hypothetical protein
MTRSDEGRSLAEAKATEVVSLPWEALDAYGSREEFVETQAGRFRVKTSAFWDMDEWASGMYVIAKVYPERGWRRWRPWKAVKVRGGPDDPVPARPD